MDATTVAVDLAKDIFARPDQFSRKLDLKGQCPIVAGSPSFHEFDVRPVVDYYAVNIPFEEMLDVVVTPAITANGRFAM